MNTTTDRLEALLEAEAALQRMQTWDGLARLTRAEIREGAPDAADLRAARRRRDDARNLLDEVL